IPYFKNSFTDTEIPKKIFIDRPGFIFNHILALIHIPKYEFPEEYKLELDFYLIECEEINFKASNSSLIKQIIKLEEDIVNISSKISDVDDGIIDVKSRISDVDDGIIDVKSRISDVDDGIIDVKSRIRDLYQSVG